MNIQLIEGPYYHTLSVRIATGKHVWVDVPKDASPSDMALSLAALSHAVLDAAGKTVVVRGDA